MAFKGTGEWKIAHPNGEDRYLVTIEWVLDAAGRPAVSAYAVRHEGGGPIPADLRRGLEAKLEEMADRLHAKAVAEEEVVIDLPDGTLRMGGPGSSITVPVERARITRRHADPEAVEAELFHKLQASRRRRKVTPDLLSEVAAVYREHPQAPTKAVSAAMYVSPAQASRYVKAAREAGLIPPREEP